MICSWILSVINPNLCTSVAYIDTTNAMWDTLKKHYAIANASEIHQLKTSIANCKQRGLTMVNLSFIPILQIYR